MKRSMRPEILWWRSIIFRSPLSKQEPISKKQDVALDTISNCIKPSQGIACPAWSTNHELSRFGGNNLVTFISEGRTGQSCRSRTLAVMCIFGSRSHSRRIDQMALLIGLPCFSRLPLILSRSIRCLRHCSRFPW